MSAEYEGQDPLEIAKQAERDLNSSAMRQGDGRNQRYDNSTSGIPLLSAPLKSGLQLTLQRSCGVRYRRIRRQKISWERSDGRLGCFWCRR